MFDIKLRALLPNIVFYADLLGIADAEKYRIVTKILYL